MSAVKSMTSAASLGLGGLARQSGQAEQVQQPSRSETPPRDGRCHLHKLFKSVILKFGNDFLTLQEQARMRCTSRHYAKSFAGTKAMGACLAQLPLFNGDFQVCEIGAGVKPVHGSYQVRDNSKRTYFYSAFDYDPKRGELFAAMCSEGNVDRCVDVYCVKGGMLLRQMHLFSDSLFDICNLLLDSEGQRFITWTIGGTQIDIYDSHTGKRTHALFPEGRIESLNINLSSQRALCISESQITPGVAVELFKLPAKGEPVQPATLLSMEDAPTLGSFFSIFSSDRTSIICRYQMELTIFDFVSQKCLFKFGDITRVLYGDQVEGMVYAQTLVESRILQINVTVGKVVQEFLVPDGHDINGFYICRASKRIIASARASKRIIASASGKPLYKIMVWDLATGKTLTCFPVELKYKSSTWDELHYDPRTQFIYCAMGQDNFRIYNFHGTQLFRREFSLPNDEDFLNDSTDVEGIEFRMDIDKQKLLIFHNDGYVMNNRDETCGCRGDLTILDFAPPEQALQTSSSGEPTAKRARLDQEHKDSKDSKDEKRNG